MVSHDNKKTWNTIYSHLKEIGYRLTKEPIIISPHQLGIPQLRERVVILGIYDPENADKDLNIKLPELMTKEEGEDHFSVLMNSVTPVWYWRVNHEYIDFLHATIKRMKMSEINDTPGLFEAQRRCSDLNSAVYKYYDNIKKRCLNGEKVSYSDLDVLNLRQCFREFSLEAYPELVALVWPEYARPEVNPDNV